MLSGKRVLIVGGGSGLGLAVARLAAQNGAAVIIASRGARRRAAELARAVGAAVETMRLDVTAAAERDELLARLGPIDHLVLAVRPGSGAGPFLAVDLDEARAAFEAKFWGQWALIREARPLIADQGSITLTSGLAGQKIYPGALVMAVINSATETLCRGLAVELAPVRVNAVCPGFVEPKPPQTERLAQGFPLGRLARPEEVARAYLAVMTNPYQTGTVTVVDGGAALV